MFKVGRYGKQQPDSKKTRMNNEIRAHKVRVIGPNGDQLGIMKTEEAVRLAQETYNLDLVEVSPMATPPVCKILDYGKHKYQMKKKAQEAKKNQTVMQVKEVKFRPKTDKHDFEFKVKHVERFLAGGNKAKVSVFFRGREMVYTGQGKELLQKVASLVEELGSIEQAPSMEGRYMSMILAPKNTGPKSGELKGADEGAATEPKASKDAKDKDK